MNGSPDRVARWGCFEQHLLSTRSYDHPFLSADLRVTFTSPAGRSHAVDGFWDGGQTWRIRFSPGELGTWRYETACSDLANEGLHGQSGTFVCEPGTGKTRFEQHGPVRLSANGRFLCHADDTPYFWLGDTVWNGPLRASNDEWEHYLTVRARQKFTAVQWVPTQWIGEPNGDAHGELAYTGSEQVEINPSFFQRMDERVQAMARHGLLNVPALLWAAGWSTRENNQVNPGFGLPEDQAVRLARYMVARWGAYPSVWILPGDGDYRGPNAERWQRIGRAVFDGEHAPVSLHPGGMQWNMAEFENEPWLDIVGYQSGHGDDEATLAWLNQGPPATEWKHGPPRPYLNLEPPYEDHLAYQSRLPHDAHSVRRALYWSLLVSPTAGVTYGGHGIWGWDDGSGPPTGHPNTGTPRPWPQALTLPGAGQLQHLSDLFQQVAWWRLRPAPELLAAQPGDSSSRLFVSAARTAEGDLAILYTPEGGCLEIERDSLPDGISALWFDPRTGQRTSANLPLNHGHYLAETPGEGDWVLLLGHDVLLPAQHDAGAST